MALFTFGTMNSDGTLFSRLICGLSGNLSNNKRRKGSPSFMPALCSLAFNYNNNNNIKKKKTYKSNTHF